MITYHPHYLDTCSKLISSNPFIFHYKIQRLISFKYSCLLVSSTTPKKGNKSMTQFPTEPHMTRPIPHLISKIKESNMDSDSKNELISLAQHLHHEYPLNVVKILRDNYIPISNFTTKAYQQGYHLKMGQLDINFPKRLFTEFDPSVILSYALPEAAMCISLLENHINGLTHGTVHHALYYFWGHSITESHIAKLKNELRCKTQAWRTRALDHTLSLYSCTCASITCI